MTRLGPRVDAFGFEPHADEGRNILGGLEDARRITEGAHRDVSFASRRRAAARIIFFAELWRE